MRIGLSATSSQSDEDPVASRIESDVARKAQAPCRPVHRRKPLKGGVVRGAAAARKAHDDHPSRVDPRMLCEKLQRPVRVADHDPATELVLIVLRAGDATPREAVDDEGRDWDGAELPCPVILQT